MSKYNFDLDYLIPDVDISIEELNEIITEADSVITNKKTDTSKKTQAYLKKVQCLQKLGKYNDSREPVEKALELQPDMPEALVRMGIIEREAKKYDEAFNYYFKAIELKPNYAFVFFNCGNVFRLQKKYEDAINNYNKAIEIKHDYAIAYGNLGIVYKIQERYEEAITNYNKAIKLKSDYAEFYFNRGIVYTNLKKHNDAIMDHIKYIEFKYFNENVFFFLKSGNNLLKQKEYDKAIAHYTQVIKLYPDYAEVYCKRGEAFIGIGCYEKSIVDINKCLEIDPKAANGYFTRANLYYAQEKYEDAIIDYDKAIESERGVAVFYFNRGKLFFDLEKYDEAIADFSNVIKIEQNVEAYIFRGNIFYYKRNYIKAINDYDEAIKLNSNDSNIYFYRGNAFYNLEKYGDALIDFNKAIEINKDFIEAYIKHRLTTTKLEIKPQKPFSFFDSKFRNNEQYISELKKSATDIAPFLGAGASKAYGYPLWKEFIYELIKAIEDSKEYEKTINAKILIDENKYMDAIDVLEQAVHIRLNTYVELIMQRITKNINTKKINENNKGFWEEYLNIFPSKTYLTINYDTVIEDVLKANSISEDEIDKLTPIDFIKRKNKGLKDQNELKDITKDKPYKVYHLHGIYTDQDSIIFSNSNYDDFYGKISLKGKLTRELPRKLSKLYDTYTFLFIGCSFNTAQDRIYDALLNINANGTIERPHFAFINCYNLTEAEMEERENKLLRINIKTIWYFAKNNEEHQKAICELCNNILEEIILSKMENEKIMKKSFDNRKDNIDESFENKNQTNENIDEKDEIKVKFEIPIKYIYGDFYKIYLEVSEGVYYLTDKKATYKSLDKVFMLDEPDVIKNLVAIRREFNIINQNNELIIYLKYKEGEEGFNDEIKMAKCKLFACISFMETMRIFYV